MIVEEEAPLLINSQNSSPFFREYLASELSSLVAESTVDLNPSQDQQLSTTFKSKLDLNWPSTSRIISDTNTFYYVQFSQPIISIYDILPEPKKHNIILNSATPIAVHVCSRVVYIVLLGGRLAMFELGKQEVNNQYISELQNVGCIYSMQTVLNQEKKESLRIAYEGVGGLRFYELHSSFSFLTQVAASLRGSNNFKHIIPISPNNLIGFVVTNQNELKLINLYTKQLMDCDPINLEGTVNLHLLNLRFATSVPSLRKRGFLTFFMVLFETNASYYKLFKIQIRLNIEQVPDKLLDLTDFAYGDLGNTVTIKSILVLNQEKQIQDIVMTEEGIYVCHKPHHNSPIVKTSFRKYNTILIPHTVEMLESQVYKDYKEDNKFIYTDDLRNRVVSPCRFTIPFLNSNSLSNRELYSKLMGMSQHDIKTLLNRLTTSRWPVAYKVIGMVNIQGILFVVRQNSISLLIRNSYGLEDFQKLYYEQQTRPFEQIISRGFQDQNEKSIVSRLSVGDSKQQPQTNLPSGTEHLDISSIKSKLERYSNPSSALSSAYPKLISAIRTLFNYTSKYNQILYQNNLSMPNTIIRNVVLAQIRHNIRVISVLLIKLYPHSQSDETYNDKNLILHLFTLNKLFNSPFKLYQSYFSDVRPGEYLAHDILALLIINEGKHVQKSFSFSSFEHHDYLKILGLILGNDLKLNKNTTQIDSLISFNGASQLLKMVVKQAERNSTMRYYAEILTHSQPKSITEWQLKAYLIAENLDNFSSKVLSLAILPDFSCKFLKGFFEGDIIYRKGRAILQYLNAITEETKISSSAVEAYIPKDYKSVVQMLLGKCEKIDMVEGIKDELRYLDQLNPRAMLSEFLHNKKLSQLINIVRATKEPYKLYLYLLQVFRKHCQLFNILKQTTIEAQYIKEFVRKMQTTLGQSFEQYRVYNGLLNQNEDEIQNIFLKNFEPFIYGRRPCRSLLYLIQKASNQFNEAKIIEFEKIPFFYIKNILNGPKDQITGGIRRILQYFTEDAVIKALAENTSTSRFLKEKEAIQSVGNYGALNYYQIINNNQLFKTVLNIINNQKGQDNRSVQKEQIVL